MDWNAVGALGEIIGASAVVVTLLFLAIQIRQTNTHTKSEALRNAGQAWMNQHRLAFDTKEKVAFMRRAMNDYQVLDQDEQGYFWAVITGYFSPFADIREKYISGLMEETFFHAIEEGFASVVTSPGAKDCIESYHQHTNLPQWIMEYVRGEIPTRKKVPPMSETFDFLTQERE